MRTRKWLGAITMMLAVGMAACANQGDETALTPTQSASGIFKEVEDTTITIEVSETDRMKGLCEVLEKKDGLELAKYNAMNRVGTTLDETGQQSLFCIDEETGVVYFVNQNKDCYIYRLKDGEVKLAVALPAKELSIWNGTVYFMIESYDKYELSGINNGDIYAYTPADGSVKAVYAAGALGSMLQQLTVKEDGVYFRCTTDGKRMVIDGREVSVLEDNHYYLPFDAKEPVEDKNKTTLPGWGDYYLASRLNKEGFLETVLEPLSNETQEPVDLKIQGKNCCIVGDDIFYVGNGSTSIYIKNIVTGEQKSFNCKEALKKAGYSDYIETIDSMGAGNVIRYFTITGDTIWATVYSVFLLCINPTTGEIMCYRMANPKCVLRKLYTDGEHLYAMYLQTKETEEYLVQIITDRTVGTDEVYGAPLLDVRFLTD